MTFNGSGQFLHFVHEISGTIFTNKIHLTKFKIIIKK